MCEQCFEEKPLYEFKHYHDDSYSDICKLCEEENEPIDEEEKEDLESFIEYYTKDL